MKQIIFLFSFIFSVQLTHAVPTYLSKSFSFSKDPEKNYQKAKKSNALRRLSLQQRIEILDLAMHEVKEDSIKHIKTNHVKRDDMVKDVILSTPERDIRELVEVVGNDIKGFESQLRFLPFEDMSIVINYTQPVFEKKDLDSKIFDIPYELFQEQLKINIEKGGDNLFQSHFTDFCGKVAVIRLWIKYNSEDYAEFMTDLYYYGEATWNGRVFVTPPSVIDAVNRQEISEDPNQKIVFKNPDQSEQMPQMMDMVLYLTLASSFHTFPYNHVDYDADKHSENSAWAGAAINPEIELLTAMGFKVEKVGDNFRGLSDAKFERITDACTRRNKKIVMLLVNSSMMDTTSGAYKDYTGPRGIEHKSFGTHWITVNYIDVQNDKMGFWEYGRNREIIGVHKLKKIVAGGIIIDGYQPL